MRSTITKFAAAAAIIITVAAGITLFEQTTKPAYAIEQTIQASHSVQYLHTRNFIVSASSNEPVECWMEFDTSGQIKTIRINQPEWFSPEDGPTTTIWKDNKAQLWAKKKNSLLTIRDKEMAKEILNMVRQLDPKQAVANIQLLQTVEQGRTKVDINEPENKSEPIVITATALKNSSLPFPRVIFFIDQSTKLLTSLETYQLKGGEYVHFSTIEFWDYNQPIDPKMFAFDNIPADAMRIDQTAQEVGLEQGKLTEKEIAVEVVRQFYEALIAKDYAKAGRLYEGVPAKKIQEMFGDMNVVQIISIGEPVPHPTPGVGGFQIPCKIEIEKNGVKSIYEPYGPGVRPVHGQPDRWAIHGGVK